MIYHMKIIKRNGSEEVFNGDKIINAVTKANNACRIGRRNTGYGRGSDHGKGRF